METPTRLVNHTEWGPQEGRQTVVLKVNGIDELLVGVHVGVVRLSWEWLGVASLNI